MTTDILTTYLEQLELSPLETKIYLTLLREGDMSAQMIIKKLQINRTSVYPPLDSLFNKGLITKTVNGKRAEFMVTDPQSSLRIALDEFLARKKQELKDMEAIFPEIISNITIAPPRAEKIPESQIKVYKGKASVKKIYEDAFNGQEFRSYVKVEETPTLSPDNPGLFRNALKKNKKLKIWEIVYESSFSRRQAMKILSENNNYFYKFMPPDLKWGIKSGDILIYDGKVAVINYQEKASCVLLQSETFYNNSKELFNFIWRMLPEVT